mgnify:CR=1 FL=1
MSSILTNQYLGLIDLSVAEKVVQMAEDDAPSDLFKDPHDLLFINAQCPQIAFGNANGQTEVEFHKNNEDIQASVIRVALPLTSDQATDEVVTSSQALGDAVPFWGFPNGYSELSPIFRFSKYGLPILKHKSLEIFIHRNFRLKGYLTPSQHSLSLPLLMIPSYRPQLRSYHHQEFL